MIIRRKRVQGLMAAYELRGNETGRWQDVDSRIVYCSPETKEIYLFPRKGSEEEEWRSERSGEGPTTSDRWLVIQLSRR